MRQTKSTALRNKLRTSFITTIISVSLVLLLLGIVGLLILNAQKLSNYVKENIGFTIFLNENIKEVEMHRLQKELDAMVYVKSTLFVTKEQAAQDLMKDLGEDFLEFLGYNPLPASISVKFYAKYATPEHFVEIEKKLLEYEEIKEIFYHKSLIHLVNENIRKITVGLLGFSILLFVISFVLINNTIRLTVYSKRFLIKTMLLVGATKGFIRTPFILKSAFHGIISAVLSLFMLSGIIYTLQKEFSELSSSVDIELIGILFLIVIILGAIISSIATFTAVNKYLNISTDDLYI
jgi:cell division transport system permease protein